MSYCQRCGEKNLWEAQFCENCGAELPPKDQERLQPGYGYDIHAAQCRHGLKLEPMTPAEKLALLGNRTYLYCGNLLLILFAGILLMTDLFRTDHLLWREFLEQRTGLFGPKGSFFTSLYFLSLLGALLFAGKPLYTRNTFDSRQLLPAMFLEALLLPILVFTVCTDGYFGGFMGTTLSTGGRLMVMVCVTAIVIQCLLIREYRRLKRSGVYHYVAN